jgi:hypothetical protein
MSMHPDNARYSARCGRLSARLIESDECVRMRPVWLLYGLSKPGREPPIGHLPVPRFLTPSCTAAVFDQAGLVLEGSRCWGCTGGDAGVQLMRWVRTACVSRSSRAATASMIVKVRRRWGGADHPCR